MLCSLVHNIAACSLDRLPAVQCCLKGGVSQKSVAHILGWLLTIFGEDFHWQFLDICSATLNFKKWTKGGIVYFTLPLMLLLRNDKLGEVCNCVNLLLKSSAALLYCRSWCMELSVLHCRVPWWSHKPLRYQAVSCCSNLRISCMCLFCWKVWSIVSIRVFSRIHFLDS